MGRYGNVILSNGTVSGYRVDIASGSVIRFHLLNAANARPLRWKVNAPMKLIGLDSGKIEKERFIDEVILHPGERATVDVLFSRADRFSLEHAPPSSLESTILGDVFVQTPNASPSFASEFRNVSTHADVARETRAIRQKLATKSPDHTLRFTMEMNGMDHGGMGGRMGGLPPDGIEWEDDMGMMNANSSSNIKWKIVDETTKQENMDIMLTHAKGDMIKLRLVNDADSMHPMQHPFHIHGVRFLVESIGGIPQKDNGWKDTVTVPAGKTADILVDASNPGNWMFHCHIAEHLHSGMMGMLRITE
jgi:suppressor of ftsI